MPKSYVKARLQAVKKLKQFLSKAFTYQVAVYTGGVSQLEWREGGQLLEPRYGLRATMLDNILYVTGGWGGPGYGSGSLTSILSWDPLTESWQAAGDLKVARYDHAAVTIPSSIIESECSVYNATI